MAAQAPTAFEVQQWLAENGDLLEAAHERISLGRLHESLQYQLQLQQNLCARAREKARAAPTSHPLSRCCAQDLPGHAR